MKLIQLLYGMATFIPGVNRILSIGSGGTNSARYCYSVWLRHLVMARKNGLNSQPKKIAELGPGDSFGIGLAALISGVEQYYAFDAVEHANIERNLAIFDELILLYRNRAPIPAEDEFANVKPYLDNYDFPDALLSDAHLDKMMDSNRLEKIRLSISNFHSNDSLIQYKAPWFDSNLIAENSIDMIYSQAVLEHVDDLETTYKAMSSWLSSTGFLSHQIDFKCHRTADEWNGHWAFSDFMWKLIRGDRPYSLNREPHSTHMKLLEKERFSIVCDIRINSKSNLSINQLAPRFKNLLEEDLITSSSFIQAVKK